MSFPRGRPVLAVLEHLDRLTVLLPSDGFTVKQVAARSTHIQNIDQIRAIFSRMFYTGRLARVGPDRYARIPGVPLTTSFPKGLIRSAVYEALSSDRHPDPWRMGELVSFVSEFTGRHRSRSPARIRNAVNNVLADFRRHNEVHRTGTRNKYRYQLVGRV